MWILILLHHQTKNHNNTIKTARAHKSSDQHSFCYLLVFLIIFLLDRLNLSARVQIYFILGPLTYEIHTQFYLDHIVL
jgi:hypothetical protein